MKLASTVPIPYFYYPGTTTTRRPARRAVAARRPQITSLEGDEEVAHKQEAVCAALLGLSFISTMVLCLWQLATA